MTTRSKTPLIVGIVLAVVLVAGLIAVVATRGSDDDSSEVGDVDSSATTPPAGGPDSCDDAEVRAVVSLPGDLVGEVCDITIEGEPLPPLPDGGTDPAVGTQPPTLLGQGFDATPVEVRPEDADEGGPTMVVFLAHWCPHCNAEIPRLLELQDDGRLPEDLRVVGVSTSTNPGAPNFPPSEWTEDMGWEWPMMVDGVDANGNFAAATAYGVTGFPFVTIIGEDGLVKYRHSGESSTDEIATYIDAALAN